MDDLIYRYVEGLGVGVATGFLFLFKPALILKHYTPSGEVNGLATAVAQVFGVTLIAYGGLIYLSYPKVDRKKFLSVLLFGDMLHLYTIQSNIELLGG